MTQTCIIIGASHAAAQLIPSLRQEGWQGKIKLIGDEPYLPYHRPPLSKTFLAGEKTFEDLALRPMKFYEKNEVEFIHGHVTSINREEKMLTLENGQVYNYDKLALCTGSRVRKATLPGVELEGVNYLRNIADVEGIKNHIGKGKSAVIIGGGYIGLEAASAMRKLGMNVTVLEVTERILQRVTAPALSAFYTRVHQEEGVNIYTSVSVTAIEANGKVKKVICADGQIFRADVIVIGIGILPNVELAQQAGIEIDNGVLVDNACRTSDPDIVAAGDCTNHYNAIYDRRLRLESVPNASDQAKIAAASICGNDNKQYNSLPWFWSEQYDLKLQIAGLSEGYDDIVIRGDKDNGRSFAAFYFKDEKLIAADCVNKPQEFIFSKKVISENININPELLADESVSVKDIL